MNYVKEGNGMNRKYKIILIAFGMLIIGYIITHYLGINEGLFKVFIGAIISLTAIYGGENLINKKISNGGGKSD